jgi:hypothetical protein
MHRCMLNLKLVQNFVDACITTSIDSLAESWQIDRPAYFFVALSPPFFLPPPHSVRISATLTRLPTSCRTPILSFSSFLSLHSSYCSIPAFDFCPLVSFFFPPPCLSMLTTLPSILVSAFPACGLGVSVGAPFQTEVFVASHSCAALA